ncbi:hypothetical protein PAGU2196_24240 [Pseudomonas sp. PAGU 2196]|uniref:hypothetical protein n=1 Tax=Pseudomonas sp. PAGU 2196 TaxID=2793997 RepID=UPI001EDF6553|nr:hypothetical protein [Pseudomonas sp. PAGU 2196]GHS81590.1 hypothetical protein PAGU2196_24240 [Pseudomonas sp. PAGU 2196]
MWFTGTTVTERQKVFHFNGLDASERARWREEKSAQPSLLTAPFTLAHALIRTSMVGSRLTKMPPLSLAAMAVSALAILEKRAGHDALFINAGFSSYKDFVGTGQKGLIGASLAYLDLMDRGYTWVAHWESLVPGRVKTAHPDFIFTDGREVCIADAKGSGAPNIGETVKSAWKRQILPNRNSLAAIGLTTTKGYVIGTHIDPASPLAIYRAEGPFTVSSATSASADDQNINLTIQQNCIADVLHFLGWDDLSDAILNPSDMRSVAVAFEYDLALPVAPGQEIPPQLEFPITVAGKTWMAKPFIQPKAYEVLIDRLISKRSNALPTAFEDSIRRTEAEDGSEQVVVQFKDGTGTCFNSSCCQQ